MQVTMNLTKVPTTLLPDVVFGTDWPTLEPLFHRSVERCHDANDILIDVRRQLRAVADGNGGFDERSTAKRCLRRLNIAQESSLRYAANLLNDRRSAR